jgi:Cys-tRNA(Pro) deacylase
MGAAEELGLDPHQVIKTLIMETDEGDPLCVLMHGDQSVSTKALARITGARSIQAADAKQATKWSGYQLGGTSPFGLRTEMPIYVQASVLDFDHIYINGGKRGFLVGLRADDLIRVLNVVRVEVTA